MKIEWGGRIGNDLELMVNDVHMGWVDADNTVHCMWMTLKDVEDDDPRDHLIESQYPEKFNFETREQAQAALLESAVPVYIGGFRGR